MDYLLALSKKLFNMNFNFCNFGDSDGYRNRNFRLSSLKWMVLFWMMLKVDVGWGQLTAPNLISNPDLTVNLSCLDPFKSFYEGCSIPWQCSDASPHHIRINGNNCSEILINQQTSKNCLVSVFNDDNPEGEQHYSEGIFQNVDIIKSDHLRYNIDVT